MVNLGKEIPYKSIGTPKHSYSKTHPVRQKCYLCGQIGSPTKKLEEEHVIPKVLFRPNYPSRYVKLWACRACNQTKKSEDEAMAPFLQLHSFSSKNWPSFDKFVQTVNEKGHHKDVAAGITRGLTHANLVTPSGVSLEMAPVFEMDADTQVRFKRYITTIAKGLYVWNLGSHPDWTQMDISVEFEQILQSTVLRDTPPFNEIWLKGPFGEHWDGYFFYKGISLSNGSAWVMCFCESMLGAVFFRPRA